MENKIGEMKNEFNNILTTRTNVRSVLDTLKQRIEKLKDLYADFIHNNDNQLFIFGLDSFRFQSRLIDIEFEDMNRLFLAISNRMYCEYFKLYKIIVAYIVDNINDKKIIDLIKTSNTFPVYKDLEPFKEYDFEIVLDLHDNILILLNSVMNNITSRENELLKYQNKKRIGLNIDNFITSFKFDIIMMREKVTLFLSYVNFFHELHGKYFKRISTKIQLMYTHVTNDIKLDESVELNRNKKDEIISQFNDGDIDIDLLTDLKRTLNITPCNSVCSDKDSDFEDLSKPVDGLEVFKPFLFENAHSGAFSPAESDCATRIENAQRCKSLDDCVKDDNYLEENMSQREKLEEEESDTPEEIQGDNNKEEQPKEKKKRIRKKNKK